MIEFHEGAHFLNSRFGYAEVCKSDRKPRSADFHSAQFNGIAEFRGSRFKANACFQHVNFGDAVFDGVQVGGDLDLTGAFFTSSERLGPLVTAQTLNLNRVRFDNPIQIEAAASAVTFQHAVFNRNATLLLRYAQINLAVVC
jgi:uncharacterized protein YjbI with pentapeptide repeats